MKAAGPAPASIKLITILNQVKRSAEFESQVLNNQDVQNRKIALNAIIGDAILRERKRELELYKLYGSDREFKNALNETIARILALEDVRTSQSDGALFISA